ncbi:MAG: NAD(P)/FAD-dependent oxidoreductase [Ferruginibacter sp.]
MKLVILGAGFGGLRLARKLNNKKGFDITLIDRFNFHQFQPLFYQVATASLDASNISFPLRKAFQGSKNVHIRLGTVKQISIAEKKVITDIGDFEFDRLVIATGAETNFFGNKQISDHSFPMKSTVEALQLRHRLMTIFEEAVNAKDRKDEVLFQRLMNIVIVGGGPTGVELSGAISEIKRYEMPRDYPELDVLKMNIFLLEGSPKILGAMSEKSSMDSRKYLERLGVTVMTDTILKDYDGATATLQNGELINTALVIWAAGIKGNIPAGISPDLILKGNRIKVNRQCLVAGTDNIYAVGDVAHMEEPDWPNGHPQLAGVAIQHGDLLAKNLKLEAQNPSATLIDFKYKDKGTMATVGRNLAVVDIPKPKLHFKGFIAWMIWMGLHLFLLLGVKNRFSVFFNWIYKYFTHDQNLRLIFKPFYRNTKQDDIK